MRFLLFILSFFLIVVSPANGQESSCSDAAEVVSEISSSSDKNFLTDQLPNKELSFSSAQVSVTVGEQSCTTSIAGRQHNYGRSHSAKKTPFKFVKNGKVIDEHQVLSLMDDNLVLSGTLSKSRYLFVIRNLRI